MSIRRQYHTIRTLQNLTDLTKHSKASEQSKRLVTKQKSFAERC